MPFVTGPPIGTIEDIRRLERVPLDEAIGVFNTYEIFAEFRPGIRA